MKAAHLVYNLLGSGLGAMLLPPAWLYHRLRRLDREQFNQRLGLYPASLTHGHHQGRKIWLHAVSVGEVNVAASIWEALGPRRSDLKLFVSTATRQGQRRARQRFGNQAVCFYAPVDLWWPVQNAVRAVQPDVLVLLETEIWPNLIMAARRSGAAVAIVNGRISVRTIRSYLKIRPLIAPILKQINAFSMISAADGARIASLGAPKARISVHGNAKLDDLPEVSRTIRLTATDLYRVTPDQPVVVAGSTRGGEEQAILGAFARIRRRHPDALLIIAPRHTERCDQLVQWSLQNGLACQRRTELGHRGRHPDTAVVVLDTMGELAMTYSIASVVFCGGSLVPLGGQNLLEAAVWGKPILYGPSMEDFSEARDMIETAGGSRSVADAEALYQQIGQLLDHPALAHQMGAAARQAVLRHHGAAGQHAGIISGLLRQ